MAKAKAVPAAVNIFAKAKAKAADDTPAKKSKGTQFKLPVFVDPVTKAMTEESQALHAAVKEFVEQEGFKKAATGRQKSASGIVMPVAIELVCEAWSKNGCQPETPVSVMAADGTALTLVMQNKANQYAFSDEQLQALTDLVGPEAANDCVRDFTKFSLDDEVLQEPGVMDKVSAALSAAGLSEAQLERLVKCTTKRHFKPMKVLQLTEVVGNDPKRLESALEILGSTLVRYFG